MVEAKALFSLENFIIIIRMHILKTSMLQIIFQESNAKRIEEIYI